MGAGGGTILSALQFSVCGFCPGILSGGIMSWGILSGVVWCYVCTLWPHYLREVAFGERERYVNVLIVGVAKVYGHIKKGGLC